MRARLFALAALFWTFGCASTPVAQEPAAQQPVEPPAPRAAPYVPNPLEDRVREILGQEMRRCWQMPTDLPNPQRLQVTVAFELNPDGSLRGAPRVTSPRNYVFDADMTVAAARALRAVRECAPYPFPNDAIVGQHYDTWDELELHFRAP